MKIEKKEEGTTLFSFLSNPVTMAKAVYKRIGGAELLFLFDEQRNMKHRNSLFVFSPSADGSDSCQTFCSVSGQRRGRGKERVCGAIVLGYLNNV
jgi:hypothetical protein